MKAANLDSIVNRPVGSLVARALPRVGLVGQSGSAAGLFSPHLQDVRAEVADRATLASRAFQQALVGLPVHGERDPDGFALG